MKWHSKNRRNKGQGDASKFNDFAAFVKHTVAEIERCSIKTLIIIIIIWLIIQEGNNVMR